MDVSIANRLYEYRRKNNLSQEELAEKIGVSRQAVSKWERAEASPDTDNLILLAKLYEVSLDELINNDPPKENKESKKVADDHVSISPMGIHVMEKDGNQVHIDWKGVHVKDVDEDKEVHVNWTGVSGRDETGEFIYSLDDIGDRTRKSFVREFPIALLAVAAYLLLGGFLGLWSVGWLVFFIIPIFHQSVDIFTGKTWYTRLHGLPILLVTVVIFLYMGLFFELWHPYWMLLLIGPIYHSLVSAFVPRKRREKEDKPLDGEHTVEEEKTDEKPKDK